MLSCVTFGYRHEGLLLHAWASQFTRHLGIVVPANRENEPTTAKIRRLAFAHGPRFLIQKGKDDPEFIEQLSLLGPDIILVHCYTYRLIPQVLIIPRLGCINIHPGKLPEYRGPRPIEAAKAKGEMHLWVTLHYMDEGFDTGDMITEQLVGSESWYPSSIEMTRAGLRLLESWWPAICDGTAPRISQEPYVRLLRKRWWYERC